MKGQFENSMRLVSHLYHNRDLQDDMFMIVAATRAYREDYTYVLSELQRDQADSVHCIESSPECLRLMLSYTVCLSSYLSSSLLIHSVVQ